MLKLIIFIILALLAAVFILSNTHIAKVNFIRWEVEMPTFLLLIIIIIIGIVLGWLGSKAKKKK
ncbi:MAG: lipopolysaccharide assembly protein LapA domain-containing protein [Nitrospirota bacterium]